MRLSKRLASAFLTLALPVSALTHALPHLQHNADPPQQASSSQQSSSTAPMGAPTATASDDNDSSDAPASVPTSTETTTPRTVNNNNENEDQNENDDGNRPSSSSFTTTPSLLKPSPSSSSTPPLGSTSTNSSVGTTSHPVISTSTPPVQNTNTGQSTSSTNITPATNQNVSPSNNTQNGPRVGKHETQSERGRSVHSPLPDSWTTQGGSVRTNTNLSSPTTLQPAAQTTATVAPTTLATATASTNLIPNPSVETAGSSSGVPASWNKGGYGTNTRVLTYPVAGTNSGKAIQVTISNYTSGDAKWYFNDVAITGGASYTFSDASMSNVPSIVTVRFLMNDGTYSYKDILSVPASSSFQTNTTTFIAPSNAKSLTIFHLINRNGSLTTDDYSLTQSGSTTPPPPPPSSNNLVPNGNFETVGTNGLPQGWVKGGYGTNTRTFAYPVAGNSGNGAQVTISSYTSGDAKWAFNPISVSAGSYTYSDNYKSTTQSIVTAQFTNSNGTQSYLDLATLPAASSWTPFTKNFTVPAGATAVTIFHLMKSNGSLTLDDVSVVSGSGGGTTPPPTGGVFSTGAMTFRFDDNTQDQYDVAAPKLDASGFKGQFYVISQQISDNGFSGYMSKAEVQNLASRGHEIGAHSRTHPHLTDLSSSQQQQEIAGSRQDLQSWGVGSVNSFAYPYGEYNATTISAVKNAGFSSAASTIDGYVTPNSDPYQLEYQEVHNDTSLATVKGWIDTAAANHVWLILTFHNIETGGDFYSTTPSMFNSIVDYVKTKGIPVITASQGRAAMP